MTFPLAVARISAGSPLISAGNTEILQNKSIKGFQISGNIFFCLLAFKFLGQKFRPGFLAVLFPFHITQCHGNLLLLLCVFFPTGIHFTDNWTEVVIVSFQKKPL